MENNSQLLIYRTPNGNTEIEVNIDKDKDTVWLTQKQIAALFQTGVDNINVHLKNIYESGELHESTTIEKNSIVQIEGNRKVKRDVLTYNLDTIISVGYRVNTIQGTHFRIWATNQLKEFVVKGFVLDDAKLKGQKSNYFDELQERVREIRVSERNFWDKVKDIFASTSMDYDSNSEIAKKFFATVQNMFHYAIHGHTAAELIKERADAYKDNMGLYTYGGTALTKKDVVVAKNYLTELEIKRLNLLSDQFLSFAELQSVEKRPMYMATWVSKLIDFLKLNEKPILYDAGKVSAEVGKQIALKEFDKFSIQLKNETKGLKKYLAESATPADFVEVKAKEPLSDFNTKLNTALNYKPKKDKKDDEDDDLESGVVVLK
ncbi:RhuM family protein [Mucilaginibacter terrae]|uniref:RhuM family protein n=1 Tax=Mucilaginibacter terrae TaxID=1955052 RepID=UPI003641CA78